MDKKELFVIFSAVVIVLISAGILTAGFAYPFDSQPRSEFASSTPAAYRAPVATPAETTAGTIAAVQPAAVPVNGSSPAIPAELAGHIARSAFPQFDPDRVNVTYYAGDRTRVASYEFDLLKDDERLAQGGIDPETGTLEWYAIPVERFGRAADPAISIGTARAAAEAEIQNREGILSLNLSEERYDILGMPGSGIAGVYIFVYDRREKADRCDSDGFTIGVDSITGTVIEYRKTWIGPPDSIC